MCRCPGEDDQCHKRLLLNRLRDNGAMWVMGTPDRDVYVKDFKNGAAFSGVSVVPPGDGTSLRLAGAHLSNRSATGARVSTLVGPRIGACPEAATASCARSCGRRKRGDSRSRTTSDLPRTTVCHAAFFGTVVFELSDGTAVDVPTSLDLSEKVDAEFVER